MGKLVTAPQLWNATNLFFKRGLFDEVLFPPVLGLNIPNYTVFDAMDDAEATEAAEIAGKEAYIEKACKEISDEKKKNMEDEVMTLAEKSDKEAYIDNETVTDARSI